MTGIYHGSYVQALNKETEYHYAVTTFLENIVDLQTQSDIKQGQKFFYFFKKTSSQKKLIETKRFELLTKLFLKGLLPNSRIWERKNSPPNAFLVSFIEALKE